MFVITISTLVGIERILYTSYRSIVLSPFSQRKHTLLHPVERPSRRWATFDLVGALRSSIRTGHNHCDWLCQSIFSAAPQ